MSADRDALTPRDPLGLAGLGDATPPTDAWPGVSLELDRSRERPKRWLKPAAAALLVASLGLITLLSGELDEQRGEIDRWISYSQLLETELSNLKEANSVLRGHEAIAVSELEDLVAVLDDRLTRPVEEDQRLALWQQRTAIMNDLVTVHATANQRRWEPGRPPAPVMTRNIPAAEATPASYRQ